MRHSVTLTQATLQNKRESPTICIKITDPEWDEAYANFVAGKNPTDSKEWTGIVVLTYV